MADLEVFASILTPTGWIELEDEPNGYWLHKDAFAKKAVSHRKREVSSEWVAGTFVADAVRENVIEDVVVYVQGRTPYEMRQRLDALTDGFDQLSYKMTLTEGDLEETWQCNLADYSIECGQEFRLARLAIVRASVPRLPGVTTRQVVG